MLKNLLPKSFISDEKTSELENISKAFHAAFSAGELQWQWDDRFNTVVADFDARYQERVLGILGGHFSDYWYNHCIGEAPGPIQRVNECLGGLKPGQLFFSTDTANASFIYCAWWPWNLGKTISIRLALVCEEANDVRCLHLQNNCKNWFNIQEA